MANQVRMDGERVFAKNPRVNADAPGAPQGPRAGGDYCVRRGDTLESILKRSGLKPSDAALVARLNGLRSPDLIAAGQVLHIPTAAELEAARAEMARGGWQPIKKAHPDRWQPGALVGGLAIPVPVGFSVAKPTAFVLDPTPKRPDLAAIERDYQVEDDTLVSWRPGGGTGWPRVGDEFRITATEAKLLDALGYQRGLLGQKEFSDVKDLAFLVSDARYPFPGGTPPADVPVDRRPEWIGNDGHRDAFRHAYWNALLTKRFGAAWTAQFTTAHEGMPGNPSDREAMDLYNNEVGRQIALAHPNASDEELADLVARAVNEGKMVVIRPGGGLEWSDRVPVWQHGLTHGIPGTGGKPRPDGEAQVTAS